MENTFGRGHCLSSFHASLGRPFLIVTGSRASRSAGGEEASPWPRALILGPPAFGVESALLALALTSEGRDGSNYGTHN